MQRERKLFVEHTIIKHTFNNLLGAKGTIISGHLQKMHLQLWNN